MQRWEPIKKRSSAAQEHRRVLRRVYDEGFRAGEITGIRAVAQFLRDRDQGCNLEIVDALEIVVATLRDQHL